MTTGGKKQSRLMRIIKAPIRGLCKARDLYVRSLSDCANMNDFSTVGYHVDHYPPLRRSYSDGDDLRELIKAASEKTYGDRVDVEAIIEETSRAVRRPSLGSRVLPKSSSVQMERIDEAGPREFVREGGPPFEQ
ncbi:hypothetical protein SAY86_011813 [Trapa natans]|uniref:Uncharacterized protein n=1 Tax=Trapa natans TaxID=22666 RepID=A0AAN7R6H1_TRANT|nr:hypothetical protein SAY86_011813 [Trapa natans]